VRSTCSRQRRSDDERSVEISLTAAGEELKARASRVPQRLVDAYNLDANEFTARRDHPRASQQVAQHRIGSRVSEQRAG
jgi:DNA-binding MarR family transcriptional regulator